MLFWRLVPLLVGLRAAQAAIIRGIAPEQAARYTPGEAFACLSGEGKVPYAAVNDNYCDCLDGSDEPGTGACAGQDTTLFHCVNEGSTPRLVYASRVDDGICDCCDGSDESGLASRGKSSCFNHCVEEGQAEKLERDRKIEMLKIGLTKKAEVEEKARVDHETTQAEINRLKAELPALEAEVEAAKKANDAAKAAAEANAPIERLQKEVAALRDVVMKQQADMEQLQSDMELIKQAAGIGDEAAASSEAGGAVAPAAGEGNSAAAPEKKVVSEYAKWMDGAGDTPGAIDDKLDVQDHLAGAIEDEEGEEEDAYSPPPAKPAPATEEAKDPTELALSAAEAKVKKNKDESRKLTRQVHKVDTDKLGFANLATKCLEKSDGQYTYKICMFEDAKQDHTLLGRWKGWEGPKTALFENGAMCPGGPARELRVVFECGSEEEMHEVTEPSRCSYEAHVSAPGACDTADAAALEKPPVKHPRTEL